MGIIPPPRAETSITTSYRTELDVSPEMKALKAAWYQNLIEILRKIVELS